MSPSERARIAADLKDLESAGEVWAPTHGVFRSLDFGKRTARFLEQVRDALMER
jgi:hypothetical protein